MTDPTSSVPSKRWINEGGFTVSTDRALLNLDTVYKWLSEQAYWALGRTIETVKRSIDHSLCFGLYDPMGDMAGFCRMVTDRATFAWLCDVFVDPTYRGTGAGTFLVRCAVEHPDLVGLKRQVLATRDAHGLYAKFGYGPYGDDERDRWMIRPGPGR